MNYAPSAMPNETKYSAKHTTTGPGPVGPQPTVATLASNAPAAYMAAQIGVHHPDGGGAQASSDMGTFVNRFNTLGVNGAIPMFDANHMPVPLYFPGGLPGGLPSGAGIPIGHAQIPIQASEGYYMPYNYAAQWATPAVPKDMDIRGMPIWPAHRVGDIVRPSEQAVVAQQDVPALDNRRSSYSTTESTPGTPFFGSTASRDTGARVTVFDRSSYTTPSPQALAHGALTQQPKSFAQPANFADRDLDALLAQEPAIPHAVPAVFTPQENMKTLEQSLVNPIPGNRNVYIRGLHPTTDDDTLYKYAERFGRVETSKAIIDTATCACKGYVKAPRNTVGQKY